jgi:hypothetical protein
VAQFREVGSECINAALTGISEKEIDLVTDVLARMRSNIVGKPQGDDEDIAEPQGRVA